MRESPPLKARPELNLEWRRAHATVQEAATAEEAAELKQKMRFKVATVLSEECLSLRLCNVEPIETPDAFTIFSTAFFAVIQQRGSGYGWRAQRSIPAGKVLLREDPLILHSTADFLSDPVVRALQQQLQPYLREQRICSEASALLDQRTDRIAERLYGKMSASEQRLWML